MIVRLLLAVVVIGGLFYLYGRFKKLPGNQQKQFAFKVGMGLLVGGLLLMVVTGKLHWLGAIFAGLIPVVQRLFPLIMRGLPLFHHLYKHKQASSTRSGNISTVQTEFLTLKLDHDSGTISGEVLSGLYSGKSLNQLSLEQAKELLRFYQQKDTESYNLLLAFLQREHGSDAFDEQQSKQNSQHQTHGMSRAEALQVLGLDDNATQDDILAAHKKLMQKLHPDRGGSNYLAAKVNEAKAFLIKK